MAEHTNISWTDHTFNPWHGCEHAPANPPDERGGDEEQPTSPECDNCYAERTDLRHGGGHWGPGSTRRELSEDYWRQPLKWNAAAQREGKRAAVFCASMADVAEVKPGELGRQLDQLRDRLWRLVQSTPWLDWQILTKLPENLPDVLPWGPGQTVTKQWEHPWLNVWVGVTCGVRGSLWRVRMLREIPAVVRFVSGEPLLEHITAEEWDDVLYPAGFDFNGNQLTAPRPAIHWLIIGDESAAQSKRRPAQPDWVRTAREAAQRHAVAFHFKQWNGPTTGGISGVAKGPGGKIHLPLLDRRRHDARPTR
jgi:protein gp37